MKNIESYTYQLEVLSPVILSPREQSAFYLKLGDFTKENIAIHKALKNPEKVNIIYPFYQYGQYEKYQPNESNYYIPGSSLKGAILSCLEEEKKYIRNDMIFDDIQMKSSDLQLRNLYKIQHKHDKDKIIYDIFFPNVAIEMLKKGSIHHGKLFYNKRTNESLVPILKKAHNNSKEKLKQFSSQIEERYNSIEISSKIQKSIDNLQISDFQENTFLLILGGYKGLFLSKNFAESKSNIKNIESAIYCDADNEYLPYGLVKFTLLG